MKGLILILVALILSVPVFSQSSFEFTVSNPFFETVNSTNEINFGEYITLGQRWYSNGDDSGPVIISYTNNQDTSIHFIHKEDSLISVKFLYLKDNGNYFFIGSLRFADSTGGLYIWEMTPEYEPVWETYYQLPPPYEFLEVLDYLVDSDGNIVVSADAYYPTDKTFNAHLYMAKVDMQGQLLSINIPAPYRRDICSALLEKPNTSGYYLFGSSSINLNVKEWIEFDTELNITGGGIFDWENGLGAATSAVFLNNGNLLIATTHFDQLSIGLLDEDFNLIRDTIFLGGGDYVPFCRNTIGYVSDDVIWIGADYDDIYWMSGTSGYYLYVFDSELNFKAEKFYGGNTRYKMMDLFPTQDNGCIVAGMVPDKDPVIYYYTDIFIKKVALEDVYTNVKEPYVKRQKPASVYPNPFKTNLNIETLKNNLKFELYSLTGNKLFTKELQSGKSTVITKNLDNGFYFYTISDENRIVQSGKLIKR